MGGQHGSWPFISAGLNELEYRLTHDPSTQSHTHTSHSPSSHYSLPLRITHTLSLSLSHHSLLYSCGGSRSLQSKAIPIPKFPPVDESVNFVGRLARELLRITDPRTTAYVEQLGTWYERGTLREIVTSKAFMKVRGAWGTDFNLGTSFLTLPSF